MSLSSSELVNTLVLPVLVGLVGGVLSAFVTWVTERAKRIRTNREQQIESSTEICRKVIKAMDELYALMKNDVWYVAWRKRQGKAEGSASLAGGIVESDEKTWESYRESLGNWRSHEITYETELRGYFGKTGYEAYLFLDIISKIDKASSILRSVYYEEPDEEMQKVMNSQQTSKEEYFALVHQMREQISRLSSTMIHCLQVGNVGTMADEEVPIPESEHEEAYELLGAETSKAFQSLSTLIRN
mmetsp:Transcript_8647/g.25941  ORF Transcript_8647/g.25941 Transcript_8647/m.25941 type:complete len:244 (-) Transcript_8647:31-762(-)